MSTATCPACDASISWTEASRSDPPACPFCGASVQEQSFSPEESSAENADAGHEEPAAETARRKIQIVEQSPDRLLLVIDPAGRGAISILFFALIWNAISWTIALMFWGTGALGQIGGMSIVAFFGIGLFLLIGSFLIAWAINSMFGRAFVLVEKDRASVQTILFGWKRTKSVEITPASLASLEEAYKQNEKPVYRVSLAGANDAVRFGTALPHADKLWTVTTINQFLSPKASGGLISSRTSLNSFEALWLAAENAASIEPANLRADSLVRIIDQRDDRLEFSMPLLPKRLSFIWASLAFVVLSLMVGCIWSAGGGGDAAFVLLLPFCLVLVLQVIACLAIFRGRISVRVDPEQVFVRWHVGPIGPSKALPTASVDKVAVVASGEAMRHLALVGSGATTIPLTTLHDGLTDREAAGLVRWQLERLGHTLQ